MLFFGGYSTGKSFGGCLKILTLAERYPNSRWAIIRRQSSQLRKTTLQTLRALAPPSMWASINENEGIYTLHNGSVIYALHLDTPESMQVLLSMDLNGIFFDQVEELSADAFDKAEKRAGRWRDATRVGGWPDNWLWRDNTGAPVPPKYIFAGCNSPGYESWVTRRWSPESEERAEWAAKGYYLITGSSRENRFSSKVVIDALLAGGEDYVRRYVDAMDWGAAEGRIVEVHEESIINPDTNPGLLDKIAASMKLHRSLDHGESAPTACLWHATDEDGNVFTYREYYRPDALVSDHRRAIFELSKADAGRRSVYVVPKYHSDLADPSIFAKARGRTVNQGPRWSVADEYTDVKVMPKETAIYWRPADNGEEVTRSRMREYLRRDPTHRHPITGELGAPRLYFIRKTKAYPNGCDEVIKDIRAQRRVEIGETSDGKKLYGEDRDLKVRDHGWDAEKYFVVSRPSLGAGPQPPKAKPGELRIDEYEDFQEKVRLAHGQREHFARAGY